jgi:tyrosine-specific transport protein
MLLIAGSCIGAGMLGLPILSGLSGFFPSLIMFFCAWLFMTLTALLLTEVNGWFTNKVNLATMVGKTLGRPGKIACWLFYLFLFYALLVAYIAGSGSLLASIVEQHFQMSLPSWGGSLIFVLLFGIIVFRGTRPVDLWNRFLMLFKIAAFLGLVFLGASHVQGEYLMRSEPQYAFFALPVLVISFGFHNMIPSITNYMGGNLKKVRQSILLGGLFALVIYLLWQIIVLGIVPMEGESGILNSLKNGEEASQAISGILGSSWASTFATLLAFFAILTSFLAQSLSLTHFLADGLKVSYKRHEEGALIMLALLPPLLLAVYFPNIFFKALNFAGGICAVILFGVLPVLMVWKGRYKKNLKAPWKLKGGRPLLIGIFLFALFVAFFQLSSMFNAPYLPKL